MFWELYGTTIIEAILSVITAGATAIAGYLALQLKNYISTKKENDTIEKIVKVAVQAGEQMYKDYHGEEKLNLVLEGTSEMLAEKGIQISEFELKWLIESAVGEFNEVFNSTFASADSDESTK